VREGRLQIISGWIVANRHSQRNLGHANLLHSQQASSRGLWSLQHRGTNVLFQIAYKHISELRCNLLYPLFLNKKVDLISMPIMELNRTWTKWQNHSSVFNSTSYSHCAANYLSL